MKKEVIKVFYEFIKVLFKPFEYNCVKVMLENRDDNNIIHQISKDMNVSHREAFKLHERVVEKVNDVLCTRKKLDYNQYIFLNFYLSILISPKKKYAREKFIDFMKNLDININFFTVEIFYLLVFGKKNLKELIGISREIKLYINLKEDFVVKNSKYTKELNKILRDARNINSKNKADKEIIKRDEYRLVFNKNGRNYKYYSRKMGVEVIADNKGILNFLNLLEKAEIVLDYYIYPFKINYEEDREVRELFPHILINLRDNKSIIVYLQDYKNMSTINGRKKRELIREFAKKNNYGYLISDGLHSYYYYKNYNKELKKEREFLLAMENEPITWKKFKDICIKLEIDTRILTSIILKNNLKYDTNPFFLSF